MKAVKGFSVSYYGDMIGSEQAKALDWALISLAARAACKPLVGENYAGFLDPRMSRLKGILVHAASVPVLKCINTGLKALTMTESLSSRDIGLCVHTLDKDGNILSTLEVPAQLSKDVAEDIILRIEAQEWEGSVQTIQ